MKIKVYARTDKVGSQVERVVEIPDEDIEGMDATMREDYLGDIARQELWSMIEWGWEEV